MSFVKYRVKEVAADFGVTPKEISEIVGQFSEKPKSNTQVLTEAELNAVFDYMTQKHQVASLEQVYAVKPSAPAKPAENKSAENKQETAKAPAKQQPQNQCGAIKQSPANQFPQTLLSKQCLPQQKQHKNTDGYGHVGLIDSQRTGHAQSGKGKKSAAFLQNPYGKHRQKNGQTIVYSGIPKDHGGSC